MCTTVEKAVCSWLATTAKCQQQQARGGRALRISPIFRHFSSLYFPLFCSFGESTLGFTEHLFWIRWPAHLFDYEFDVRVISNFPISWISGILSFAHNTSRKRRWGVVETSVYHVLAHNSSLVSSRSGSEESYSNNVDDEEELMLHRRRVTMTW